MPDRLVFPGFGGSSQGRGAGGGCVEVAVLSAAVAVRDPAASEAGSLVLQAAAAREFEDRVEG
ncbi:DUF397 domain-containing protein [Amycolatopsis sp. NPDC059657]|uniref:DUF397 domain-containing protein n=1 Tax=Amycolatopsis sp. NPDC059657 TaxID=3346899 RepID=UPI00366AA450